MPDGPLRPAPPVVRCTPRRRVRVGVALLASALALAPAAVRASETSEPGATLREEAKLTEMGKFFELSEPPSQDLVKARDLYCRAAGAGHPEAVQRLGWLYLRGLGVQTSPAIAGTLFRWAAELGDARAEGLSRATPVTFETPPPCMTAAGLTSVARLRERQLQAGRLAKSREAGASASAAAVAPNSTVDNPAQFRQTPAALEHRQLVGEVLREAKAFRLDPRLVLAVMRIESNFDVRARSPKNAQGLMQLIPETAQRFNVRDPFDPIENLRGGMAYLRWLLAYYQGDVALTLAAYNAGEGAVDRFRGVPPYGETIAYVQRIRALYPFDRHPFDVKALAAGERSWLGRGLVTAP